ncbi:MAG: hypothetical protein FJ161_01930, partial [Gammaproteobacteria bacterium]|nr:hypothetical protein [Gammaproteobacteria bacterium]
MNEAYNDIFQKLEEKWIFSDPVTARECLPGAIRVLNPLRHNELSLSVYDFFRNLWANHIDICTPPYLKPVIVVVGSDEDFLETQNTLIQSLRLPPSFELNILQHDVSTTSMSADLSERIITDTRSDYLISIQHHEDEDNDRSFWSIVIYDMVDRVSLELQESELETVIEKIKQYIISV